MTGKANDPAPSPAVEDYLKAIYQLTQEGRPVSTSAIADRLGVAAASVTGMLKRLAEQDLVEHVRYRGASLTGAGESTAIRLVRRHRILELFLVNVLGYTWDTVHDQAERLEHAASDELIDRMASILGEPAVDPHGDPIPAAAGPFREPEWPALSELGTDRPAVLRRVSDADPAVLRYLAELGLMPGVDVVVTHQAPFGGPLTVRTGQQSHVLGRALCATIQVEPLETSPS